MFVFTNISETNSKKKYGHLPPHSILILVPVVAGTPTFTDFAELFIGIAV